VRYFVGPETQEETDMAAQEIALTIRRNFERASADLLRTFGKVPTGNVCDSQDRVGALDYRIKPVSAVKSFCGSALPVDAGPRDNLAAWAALGVARPGDVILIRTGEFCGSSVIGDVFAGMAKNGGVAAIVTDGVVRDIPGIDAVGIPVFARGVSPNSPWKNGPGRVGLPMTIGGVTVDAGDIVVGDQDGVVIVPRASAAAVAETLAAVLAKEVKMDQGVKAGLAMPGWLEEACRVKGVTYID
jgi:4-hydroxy-4-methyl-2-oxoglutarate aldolase